MKRKMKFDIRGSKADGYTWVLYAPNGAVLARSPEDPFNTLAIALKSVRRLQSELSTVFVNGTGPQ